MKSVPTAATVIDTLTFLDRLACLPRTGWLLRGVTDVESIAEHAYGVAVVAGALVDDLRARGVSVDGERPVEGFPDRCGQEKRTGRDQVFFL